MNNKTEEGQGDNEEETKNEVTQKNLAKQKKEESGSKPKVRSVEQISNIRPHNLSPQEMAAHRLDRISNKLMSALDSTHKIAIIFKEAMEKNLEVEMLRYSRVSNSNAIPISSLKDLENNGTQLKEKVRGCV